MKKIGIIGGGFTGTMAAVQMILKSSQPCEIILISEKNNLNKGIAYNSYSKKHLLNVITAKMSAYPDDQDHFLDWVMQQKEFESQERTLIAVSFLPRQLYGEYLTHIWNESLLIARSKSIFMNVLDNVVLDLDVNRNNVLMILDNGKSITVDECIIATGNNIPRNPIIRNEEFYGSKNYFQNPWKAESVENLREFDPVLIIGNGLTMVDTVLGLLEKGFKGKIYSISPNGFNILAHRHTGIHYSKLSEELKQGASLQDLVSLFNRHIKAIRKYGISAEPVIDSLRPHTQKIWMNLSVHEKQIFMSRLRHLWGVARHRVPLHTHDKIQQLRIEGRLQICSGQILNLVENERNIMVEYYDTKDYAKKEVIVARVINCTGPETDLIRLENSFLKKCLQKGIITQDPLKLGINANADTFEIIGETGQSYANLFTIGSNLKGMLWESTAVNELRVQVEKLAERLSNKVENSPVVLSR
jgi:uncharacterized NAD(P)/FAD-binding protein YdhS